VTATPDGKTQKEKNRNLKELLQMTVALGDQQIPIKEIPFLFDWKPNAPSGQRTPVRIFSKVKEQMGELTLPPVIITPHIVDPLEGVPVLSVPSNVMLKGDLLNVYTNQQFTPGEKFIVTDANGQRFTLQPKCMSAQQAVIQLPDNIVPGEITVSEEVWNQPADKYSFTNTKLNLVDLSISSPNTNLRPGQKSEVIVSVIVTDSKGEWVNPDIEKLINGTMTIDLRNLNPNTVTMQGGNRQLIRNSDFTFSPQASSLSSDEPAQICWQIRRGITGNAVGSFSVSATLHEDYNTSNDPFRPQLNALQTPENFNAWANALKKDLKEYAAVHIVDVPGAAPFDPHNINRAIGNMPVCTIPEQLEECKVVAYSLVQPLQVPKGAANTWLSSYETFKSLLTSFRGTEEMSKLFQFNMEVVDAGLYFMERVAHRTNDQSMMNEIINARSTGGGDIKPEDLQILITKTDEKIKNDPEQTAWKLFNLAFSTFCFDKKAKDGIDPEKSMVGGIDPVRKILHVNPEYQERVLNSLNAIPLGNGNYHINAISETRTPVSYTVQVKPLIMANVFDSDWWAEHLINEYIKKDTSRGNIITTTKDSTGTYYIFYKDAQCVKNDRDLTPGSCFKETEWDSNEKKVKETGRYKKITLYPTGTCKKGTEFCTEVYVVTSISQIFMDANCTRMIKTEDFKHFSCL
ncbi:MAG: hypothetical protein HZB42_07335, partial [Sphingobacteriales bacterium]|nr:hypothetical protein [Sphingobacteriales bacterium]